jgi:hypothetical protein
LDDEEHKMSDGSKNPIEGMTPEQQESFNKFLKKEHGDLHLEKPSDPNLQAGNAAALERLKQDNEYHKQLEENRKSELINGTKKYLERLRQGCQQYYTDEAREKIQDISDALTESWGKYEDGYPWWLKNAAIWAIKKIPGVPDSTIDNAQARIDALQDLINRSDRIRDITSTNGWQNWGYAADCIDFGAKEANPEESYSDDLDKDSMICMAYRDLPGPIASWGQNRGLAGDIFVRTTEGCIFPMQFVRDGRINPSMINPNSQVFINLDTWKKLQSGTSADAREFRTWKRNGQLVFPSADAFNKSPLTAMKDECLVKRFGGKDEWLTKHPSESVAYTYWEQKWGSEMAHEIVETLRPKWLEWHVVPYQPVGPLKPVPIPTKEEPTQGVTGPWMQDTNYPTIDSSNLANLANTSIKQTNSLAEPMPMPPVKTMRRAALQQQKLSEGTKTGITAIGILVGILVSILTTPLVIPTTSTPPFVENVPALTEAPPMVESNPVSTEAPAPVAKGDQPAETEKPAPAEPQDQPPAMPAALDRCGIFEDIKISFVWLDPPSMYVKMAGGVPGQERAVPGDSGDWNYRLEVGGYRTDACRFIKGYEGRLYCDISLPPDYIGSAQPLKIYVSGCSQPIYSSTHANIFPGGVSSSSESDDSGSKSGSGSGESPACTSGEVVDNLDAPDPSLSSCTASSHYPGKWVCICP